MESRDDIEARRHRASDEDAARAARSLTRGRAWLAMLVLMALAVAVRLVLLSFPMGPYAGTIAYVGRRWTAGALPYRDVWDTNVPGLYVFAGAVVRLLGPTVLACRAAMLAFDLGTLLLVYAFVRRWCNRTEAVAAAGIFGFFSGAALIQGDCLGPGPPMTFFVAAAFLAALRSQGRSLRWLALSGLAGGIAVCLRPIAAIYVLALALWAIGTGGPGRSRLVRWGVRPLVVLAYAALPAACFAAYFASKGAFHEFWRNAVVYNYLYRWPLGSGVRWARSARESFYVLAPEQGALWLFAGGWAIHAFSMGFRRETALVVLWGVLAVAAGLFAWQVEAAHFLETVPPLAIAAALAATNPAERLLKRDAQGRLETRSILLMVFTAGLALGFLHTEWRAYRARTSQSEFGTDLAAAEIAKIIRERTTPSDPIYVWGTRPQIYVLADRPAAHRIFYNRPLNSPRLVAEFFGPQVFEDITETIIRVQPCFVVTTEEYLPEHIDRLGPIAPLFYYLSQNYDRSWKIIHARPYDFTIFARQDRALMP